MYSRKISPSVAGSVQSQSPFAEQTVKRTSWSSSGSSRSSSRSSSGRSSQSPWTPTDEMEAPLKFAQAKFLRIDTQNLPKTLKNLDVLLTPPEKRNFDFAAVAHKPLPPLPTSPKNAASVRAKLPAGKKLSEMPASLQKALMADDERVSAYEQG